MKNFDYHSLKNGSDVRGIAMEGVQGQSINLTEEAVERIAKAFCVWLISKTGKTTVRIAVGYDSRLSSPALCEAVVRGIVSTGHNVLVTGLSTTPSMFMLLQDPNVQEKTPCHGSIMITASHLPFNRNGLKFFVGTGGLESADISTILEYCQQGQMPPAAQGQAKPCDYMTSYAARLRQLIVAGVNAGSRPLEGFHIVVDAGNGAGGFYATQVLEPLGADISGSQFLDPDGRFPNHVPNPEDKKAMESACQAVINAKADMGVIFDTDVDRAGCVDGNGKEINRNRLIALASVIALENNPGGTVVTDSITSSGLKTFIEKDLGGVHLRFKRGYKNVINEALRLNAQGINAPLAIETSGHAALRDNYFLDDGAYLATQIIIKAACLAKENKTLQSLIATLAEPLQSCELRFTITKPDFAAYGKQLLADLETYAADKGWLVADDSREGVRVSFPADNGDGWFLLRLSVHDPVMPLNIESDSHGGCQVIAVQLLEYLKTCDGLDLSALERFLGL